MQGVFSVLSGLITPPSPTCEGVSVELRQEGKGDILLVVILYFIAHGLLLFNTGVYWDDWIIVGVEKPTILAIFSQTRTPWAGYIHSFLLSLPYGLFIYRAVVFFGFLFSALLFNAILKTISCIDRNNRLIIVLFFALFPVNGARVALINVFYPIFYLSFFLGFWILTKYVRQGGLFLRILSLILFVLSFATNSLLCLYAIVILYLAYHLKNHAPMVQLTKKIALCYFDFLAAPAIFWAIKVTCLRPYGTYAEYNSIKLINLGRAFPRCLSSLYTSFIEVIDESIRLSADAPSIIFILSILLFFVFKRKNFIVNRNEITKHAWFLGIGTVSFVLAVFPYLAVGKTPALYSWDSRHQLLVPLGASLMLTYGINIIFRKIGIDCKYKYIIFSFLIVSFACFDINRYLDFERDWYKHISLIENFKANNDMKNHTTFYFVDNTIELNATRKDYVWYEYTGMMKKSFGDEKRFGSSSKSFHEDFSRVNKWYASTDDSEIRRAYLMAKNIRDYQPRDLECVVNIGLGSRQIPNNEILGYISDKFFRRGKFIEKVKEMTKITVTR